MDTPITVIPNGSVTSPRGYRAGATAATIKTRPGALDLALLVSDRETTVAGMFTRNLIVGAPVVVSRERIANGRLRAVVGNSGCANALNGTGGYDDAVEMTVLAARHLGIEAEDVAVASTGVTGVRLPMQKLRDGLPRVEVRSRSTRSRRRSTAAPTSPSRS